MSAAALFLAATLAGAAPAGVAPAGADGAPRRSCIQVGAGSETRYHPVDDHTIAVESQRRWYRLVVSPEPRLMAPTSFLINDIRGTSTLCSALDFDLSVAETSPGGFRSGVIVQSFEPISTEEGVALSKRSRR